jgi:uncharacterized protein (DUF1697 family)
MNTYVLLLRGINVGGKNQLHMAGLASFLVDQGCSQVRTYIQSGNAILRSPLAAKALTARIEKALPQAFALDSAVVRVLVPPSSSSRQLSASGPRVSATSPPSTTRT